MIDDALWKSNIEACIREFSDPSYQLRIWVNGEGPQVSSFVEAMCRLYDDCLFENFIAEFSTKLEPSVIEKLKKFSHSLEDFSNSVEDCNDDQSIIHDSRWKNILEKAAETYNALKAAEILK